MKRLLLMDDKDYDPDLPEIYRVAVRGIIFIDGKLLLIESNFGELKLPGGGQEMGEDAIQKNEEMLRREGEENVNIREYRTLLLIREHLEQRKSGEKR